MRRALREHEAVHVRHVQAEQISEWFSGLIDKDERRSTTVAAVGRMPQCLTVSTRIRRFVYRRQ
jgi:hypothetical protein